MINKNTILKILNNLNLPADEKDAKLIASYANKGGANVQEITKKLKKVSLDNLLERAKVFFKNKTPTNKEFL